MITISSPEKYVAGLYEKLSNEKIEVADGVIVNSQDELESGRTNKFHDRFIVIDNK